MEKDSIQNIVKVTFLVCLLASIAVSSTVIILKPIQKKNEIENQNRNILLVAGLYDKTIPTNEQFELIDKKIIKLQDGNFANNIAIEDFDQLKLKNNQEMINLLSQDEDVAKLGGAVEKYSLVYLVWNENRTKVEKIIFPIRGYALWSTVFGYISIASDFNTIQGIEFYQHAETPGLGSEIDNPNWKKQWVGKKLYNDSGKLEFEIVKNSTKNNQIDSVSGATLTSNGILNMIRFWFSEDSSNFGFYNFLKNLQKENIKL